MSMKWISQINFVICKKPVIFVDYEKGRDKN